MLVFGKTKGDHIPNLRVIIRTFIQGYAQIAKPLTSIIRGEGTLQEIRQTKYTIT